MVLAWTLDNTAQWQVREIADLNAEGIFFSPSVVEFKGDTVV